MLVEEIVAANPDAVALEAMCREIRRTRTFVPSIPEVRNELIDQMIRWSDRRKTILDLESELKERAASL